MPCTLHLQRFAYNTLPCLSLCKGRLVFSKGCQPCAIPACVQVRDVKTPILEKAADRIRTDSSFRELRAGAEAFRQQNPWVEDSALFYALSHHRKELVGKAWWEWPEPVR